MEFRHLKFEINSEFAPTGQLGILTLNRPAALNALNTEVIEDLQAWLEHTVSLTDLRCVIVTGSGDKAFVAGADIKEMQPFTHTQAEAMSLSGQKVMQGIEDAKFVTLAAVNGFALGGGLELAMACDFIVAASTARFGLPEVSLGLIPGYGGTQRLSRYVGKSIARLITLTGDMFNAPHGLEWGLFAKVVEPAELMPTCLKLAKSICARSPQAIGLAKQAINQGHDMLQVEAISMEAELFAKTFTTEDHSEGLRAFIEKRAPHFKGV